MVAGAGGGVGVDAVRRRVGVGPTARQVVGGAAGQVVAQAAAAAQNAATAAVTSSRSWLFFLTLSSSYSQS
ncbi:hypothetical protein ACWD4N_16060 [Streptomyces sp. NPDC002586]|uniref:hypothetical protein n=1 Tax=Streptomyces sp. CG4 TaxID=408783 RepID=UPI0034E1A859